MFNTLQLPKQPKPALVVPDGTCMGPVLPSSTNSSTEVRGGVEVVTETGTDY